MGYTWTKNRLRCSFWGITQEPAHSRHMGTVQQFNKHAVSALCVSRSLGVSASTLFTHTSHSPMSACCILGPTPRTWNLVAPQPVLMNGMTQRDVRAHRGTSHAVWWVRRGFSNCLCSTSKVKRQMRLKEWACSEGKTQKVVQRSAKG